MNTKLTLNLDKNIIKSAKEYAKNRKVSLSQLIENYLNSLTKKEDKDIKVSPLVESLTGVIPNENKDYKTEYYDYLSQKYS
jgi:ribosome recycling factor